MSTAPTTMTPTRVVSPTEWVKKQLNVMTMVGKTNYELGIARPKRSPIEAGSSDQSEAKYQAQLMVAFDKKSRQRGVAASTDQIWFDMSRTLGAENLVKGVTKREAKIRKFVDGFHPQLLSHLGSIDLLPVTSLEERLAKMTANARGLAALRGVVKG